MRDVAFQALAVVIMLVAITVSLNRIDATLQKLVDKTCSCEVQP